MNAYTSLSTSSTSSSLTLTALRHDVFKKQQYFNTKNGHSFHSNGTPARQDDPVSPTFLQTASAVGTVNVGSGENQQGCNCSAQGSRWCFLHVVVSYNMDQCQARVRHKGFGNTCCSFHEFNNHGTNNRKAKNRQN